MKGSQVSVINVRNYHEGGRLFLMLVRVLPRGTDLRRDRPSVDGLFDPVGHGHSPNMAAFANQVHDGPMPLPNLDVLYCESR